MTKVAALVLNSVAHDARVIKEAESLAEAGFDVRIFGVVGPGGTSTRLHSPRGVPIVLLAYRSKAYLLTGWAIGFAARVGSRVASTLWTRTENERARQPMTARPTGSEQGRPRRFAATFEWLRVRSSRRFWQLLILDFVRTRAFVREIKEFGAEIVHCHDLLTVPIGVRYKRLFGVKVVFDSHEIYEELSLANASTRATYAALQRKHSGDVDGFITVNDSIASYLKEKYPKLPEPVVVKNATRSLEPPVCYDGCLHRAAGLDPDTRILLFHGGFADFRGLRPLIESASFLRRGWAIVLMGWGSFEDELRRIAGRLDTAQTPVHFLPPVSQDQLPLWTAGATIGIIPYENVSLNHYYCTPNKIWEYAQVNVPMLVSPWPELRLVVEEHRIGWLLDENGPSARGIAERVNALDDEAIAEARGRCAAFLAKDNWSVYEKRLLHLYARLGAGASPARSLPVPDPVRQASGRGR